MFVLDEALQASYDSLFNDCQINENSQDDADRIIQKIVSNRQRYEEVSSNLNIPWFVIAVIHNMESGLSFNTHLHNGDPLSARTVHVPAGRPAKGDPPFSWEESAVDALQLEGFDHWTDWTIPGICFKLEKYNGIGYRGHGINSPYLWGSSNNYTSGKYVQDGVFSPTAVSKQIGAMVILKIMQDQEIISLADEMETQPG